MPCSDANVVVAFAAGTLTPRSRSRFAEHVDACPQCAEAVAVAAVEMDQGPELGDGLALARGAEFGRFVILERIGAGGLGIVYAAYDPTLDRRIAIKVMRSSHANDDGRAIVREAKALARVAHPNVVPIHDLGIVDGALFIAMELVDGQTLQTWLAQPRTWQEVRGVFADATRGLTAVHDAGLVHRDVKPSNIIVGTDGRARILDFGLASLEVQAALPSPVGVSVDAESSVSRAESRVVGTPAYMAPEQHRNAEVDARADQFSLCTALFEALAGARPFDANQVRAAAQGQALPLPTAKLSGVPKWLRRVVERGLQPEPALRFPSMAALGAALYGDRHRRWRGWMVLGFAAAAVAGGVVAGGLLSPPPPARQDSEVESLRDEAHRAAAQNRFVYPPATEPRFRTALVIVDALEQLDDPRGASTAQALRAEFAATLAEQGDRYWDEPGGRGFAADYYVQVLLFDPEHEVARQRALASRGQLAALAQAARRAEFSVHELHAAEPLVLLAEMNAEHRRAAVKRFVDAPNGLATTTNEALCRLVGEPPPPPVAATPRVPIASTATPSAAAGPTKAKVEAPTRGGSVRAGALVRTARAALRRRELDAAAAGFRRALAEDPSHVGAQMGLAETLLERNEVAAAVRAAERAVELGPRRASAHLLLGDLYRKVRRYAEARSEYAHALRLGSRHAQAKLDRLDRSIGPAK